jgi:hypothetical protein
MRTVLNAVPSLMPMMALSINPLDCTVAAFLNAIVDCRAADTVLITLALRVESTAEEKGQQGAHAHARNYSSF